jgi:ankyrin repeat protein
LFSISKLSLRYLIDSLLARPNPSVRIVRPLVLNRTVDPYQPNSPTADINAPTSKCHGRTALQAALEQGHIELIQLLLNGGADVNAPPSYIRGVTAIQATAIKGHITVVQLLLDYGTDVNAAPAVHEGRTALEGAAEHGRIDILQLLINAGARTIGDGQNTYG